MSDIQQRFIAKQKQELAKAKNEPKKDKQTSLINTVNCIMCLSNAVI